MRGISVVASGRVGFAAAGAAAVDGAAVVDAVASRCRRICGRLWNSGGAPLPSAWCVWSEYNLDT